MQGGGRKNAYLVWAFLCDHLSVPIHDDPVTHPVLCVTAMGFHDFRDYPGLNELFGFSHHFDLLRV
jgi:hypothetical protein